MHSIKVDGHTRLMGLIGHNISYTRSPSLHNCSSLLLGINAVYLPIDVKAESVSDFLRVAWDIGAIGFNVTTPHKSLVAKLVGLPDDESVNTIRRGSQGWEATSTDGKGFVRGLARMGSSLDDFDAYIFLGNGGAVRAIIRELDNKPIRILRRDGRRDLDFVDQRISFDEFTPVALSRALRDLGLRSLLIQATNAPQYGISFSEFAPPLVGFKGAVSDLVYAKPSVLVDRVRALGLPAQDGESMLIEQARLSQLYWWGRSATFEDMTKFLKST